MRDDQRIWEVCPDALADAAELLGIKMPIHIRYNGRYGSTRGSWTTDFRDRMHCHVIMLKSYRTQQAASVTLWHELTHAMQFERAGRSRMRMLADSEGLDYLHRPHEIEARELSYAYSDVNLLRTRTA